MNLYYISFYCFSSMINLFYYLFIIYCVSNTISPQQTQTFLINASWATVRLYHSTKSKTIKFLKNQLDKYMSDDIKQVFTKKSDIELERTIYIKDGNETYSLMKNSDMVLTFFNNLKTNDNIIPVLRSNEADSFNTALIDSKLCDFKFITILLIPDKNNKKDSIPIDLSKPFNYYIEDNIILDYLFVGWYCKKYYNLEVNRNNYAIEIFDQNATYMYLTCEHEIILNKTDYNVRAVKNNNNYIKTENIVSLSTNSHEYEDADKVDSDNDNNIQTLTQRKSIDINLEN